MEFQLVFLCGNLCQHQQLDAPNSTLNCMQLLAQCLLFAVNFNRLCINRLPLICALAYKCRFDVFGVNADSIKSGCQMQHCMRQNTETFALELPQFWALEQFTHKSKHT